MAGAIEIVAQNVDGADQAVYTMSSVAAGAAADDRFLEFNVGWREGSVQDRALDYVEINGNEATIVRQDHAGDGGTGIAILLVPAGTTADIEMGLSGSVNRIAWTLKRLTGIDPAAIDGNGSAGFTDPATAIVVDVDTVDGGVVSGYMFQTDLVGTPTLLFEGTDGLTEGTQQNVESLFFARPGYAEIATGQTPRDINANFGANGQRHAVTVVSYAPAAAPAGTARSFGAVMGCRDGLAGSVRKSGLWVPERRKLIAPRRGWRVAR